MTLRGASDSEERIMHAARKWGRYAGLTRDWRDETVRLMLELGPDLSVDLRHAVAESAGVTASSVYNLLRSKAA